MFVVLISHLVLMLTDESTASNRHSILLKLPQEIKDQIYELVLGGNLLHFPFNYFNLALKDLGKPQTPICHVTCQSQITEEDAQASFDASTSPWFDETCAERHEGCLSPVFNYDVLDLRFLRTCRQIYEEASCFFYDNNIFSFDDWPVFVKCAETVSWMSRIRNLRLCIRTEAISSGSVDYDTLKYLTYISSKLTNLQSIHIDLQLLYYITDRSGYNQQAEEGCGRTQKLLCFAGTALRAATVAISDDYACSDDGAWQIDLPGSMRNAPDDAWSLGFGRWTMAQKQEHAHFLRDALLQHRGKGIDIEGYNISSKPEITWSRNENEFEI